MSTESLRATIRDLMPQAKADLASMVSFKSVHDAKQFPPAECQAMVDFVVERFAELGLRDVQGYETPDGSKAVCGHKPGPPGSPTVLLYFHHDVQPPLDNASWETPVWDLTEKNGRWYGRGAADCKGNIAVHLTALRALGDDLPVGIKIVGEGSEEQGTGGLEAFVPEHADLLSADAILVCDTGNFAVGVPSLTTTLRGLANVWVTVRTLSSAMHSGMFGGAAPDALAALIAMLATLRDEHGNTTIKGLDATQTWDGAAYPPEQFRKDANVLPRCRPARWCRRRHGLGAADGNRARNRLPTCDRLVGRDPAGGPRPDQPPSATGNERKEGANGPDRPPCLGGTLACPGGIRARGRRRTVCRHVGRPRLRVHDDGHAGRVRT